jgi:hypothetical protein
MDHKSRIFVVEFYLFRFDQGLLRKTVKKVERPQMWLLYLFFHCADVREYFHKEK